MQKFLTCALCFLPTLAGAITLYYTPGRECDGLYLKPSATGCPDDSQRVVKLHVTKRADANFGGFKINGVEIVDSTGAVKSNAAETLATATTTNPSAKVTGDYECLSGTNKNASGTCVEKDGDYINTNGETVAPSGLTCWRDENGDGIHDTNYCYWNVNITFHSKPANNTTVTGINDPNDGQVLTSKLKTPNSNWCYEYAGTGSNAYCTRIHMPTSPNYQFRGYYLGKVGNQTFELPNDIITDHSTTNGGAFSVFYPKNIATNNDNISITEHTIVVMSNTPVPPNASINVDLYGAWARKCDADANAVCTLKTGVSWNVTDNLGKGDVRYDTGCADGYVISGGAGTYKPICETEKGEDLTINYTFRDQFGNPATCNGPTGVCTLADTYNLIGSTAVQTACGNDYTLKYLVTGGVNGGWHRPGTNVSCGTNEFGTNRPASVVGTVCKNVCTIGQHYDNLHATCVQMVNGPSLGNLPTPTYMTNGGYYVIDTYQVENLWDGCPTLSCDDDYGLVIDSNGPRCIEKPAGTDFQCPSVSGISRPSNVTLGNPAQSNGTTCTYTVGCNADYLDLIGGNGTITCIGTACDNLQNLVNAYSCQLHCPESGWTMGNVGSGNEGEATLSTITYGRPTYDNGMCRYNVSCKDSSKTLYHNDTACTSNCQVTCNSYDDCYGVIMQGPTYTNMHDKFSEWECK